MINRIFPVDADISRHQKADDFEVACGDALVQGCRMGVIAFGVVAIRIFAGILRKTENFDVAHLRGESGRAVTVFGAGGREKGLRLGQRTKSGGGWQRVYRGTVQSNSRAASR